MSMVVQKTKSLEELGLAQGPKPPEEKTRLDMVPKLRSDAAQQAALAQETAQRNAERIFGTVAAMFGTYVQKDAQIRNSELGKLLIS